MKYFTGLLLSLFVTFFSIGQEIKPLSSFVSSEEEEEYEDFQISSDGAHLLTSHYINKGLKREYDKFIVYKLDEKFNKTEEVTVETGLQVHEGLAFIGFLEGTWYYLTEKKVKSYTFEYTLMSIDINGKIERKTFKELILTKPSRMHIGNDGLITHRPYSTSGGASINLNKSGFFISMRISHTNILVFAFSNKGELKYEKDIRYIEDGEKTHAYDIPYFYHIMIDDNNNIYYTLGYTKYLRYCSLVDGKISRRKEPFDDKKDSWNFSFICKNDFCKYLKEYSMRVGDSLNYQGKKIFMSAKLISGENNSLLRDLVVFSVLNNTINELVKIDRATFVGPANKFKPIILPFKDSYYILFNSRHIRTGIKGALTVEIESLFLTKLNSNLNELSTTEIIEGGEFFVVKKHKDRFVILTYKEDKYQIFSFQLD